MLVWTSPAPQPLHSYTPSRPSPLAPRPANAFNLPSSSRIFTMDAPSKSTSPPQSSFSKRAVKPNPLMQRSTGDAARERRRDLFLKKVSNDRDERRWAGRADQVMRLDYMKDQKRWEAQLARSAPSIAEPDAEEEEDFEKENRAPVFSNSQPPAIPNFYNYAMPSSQSQPLCSQNSDAEVEAIAQQEDEELDALLAMMEEEDQRANAGENANSQTYGSDEEDYESIFKDYLEAERAAQRQDFEMFVDQDFDAMDMTTG